MRTQQLFHLQKALVMHSGEGGGEGGGIIDQVRNAIRSLQNTLILFASLLALPRTRTVTARQRLPWAMMQETNRFMLYGESGTRGCVPFSGILARFSRGVVPTPPTTGFVDPP